MKNGFDAYIKNLENLRAHIDYDTLARIEQTIGIYIKQKNNFLYMAGVGKNSDILHQASKTYNSVGVKTINLDITNCKHGDFGLIHEHAVLICTSKSGNTKELIEFMQLLKKVKKGTQVILIHSSKLAITPELCDISLYVPCIGEADSLNIIPSCSLINFSTVLHLIVFSVIRDKFTLEHLVKNHPLGSIGKVSDG
jgi:D-arabinose 5-phosphate isomerase GutQ